MSKELSFYSFLVHAIGAKGDALALVSERRQLSGRQLLGAVEVFAERLEGLGFAGRPIAVCLPNCPEYLVAFLALLKIHACAVVIDPSRSKGAIETYLRKIPVDAVIGDAQTCANFPAELGRFQMTLQSPAHPGFEWIGETAPGRTAPIANLPCKVMFTSGSTGLPKAIPLFDQHLISAARYLSEFTKMREGHIEYLFSPLCHMDGWQRAAGTMHVGGRIVFHDYPLSGSLALEGLLESKAEGAYFPPPLVKSILLSKAERELRALESQCPGIEVGSYPYSVTELTELNRRFPGSDIFVHYGLTECSRATLVSLRRNPEKIGSVGRAAPGLEVKVLREDGLPCGAGELGEIVLRGGQTISGYWEDAALNGQRFSVAGFFTGDSGYLDSDGYLYFRGRRDDMIFRGAHHIFPSDVLNEIRDPDVAALPSVVLMLSSDDEEEDLIFAFRESEGGPGAAKVQNALQKIPEYLQPDRIVALKEIPLLPSGKIDRKLLVEAVRVALATGKS